MKWFTDFTNRWFPGRPGIAYPFVSPHECYRAPKGWWCSRPAGHEGPCAAHENTVHHRAYPMGNPPLMGDPAPATVSRADYNRVTSQLQQAKALLVSIHANHPETQRLIEANTGSWMVFGINRF